ncbi:MAG: class A beta-lactamase-related serine hydrolase, partial [candidate division Zixibacteria bacterium]|nr:class A beta-lactamase-related serine hydrolase [candidate division Zixibacteria bacterium]
MKTVLPLATAVLLLLHTNVHAQNRTDWAARIQSYAEEFGGRVGLAAKSLTTGETIAVNADTLFPTASVIKLPVLVELFYQFREGKLTPDKAIPLADSANVGGDGILRFLHEGQTLQLVDIAALMIILSDNTATNYVI